MSTKATTTATDEVPYNAGNQAHVRDRQKASDIRELTRAAGLKLVMSSREGRAWMYGVLETCGVWRSSFTGNSETFMREGQRNVGLVIMADIQRDHDELYIVMCREAREMGSRGYTPKKLKEEASDT